MLVVPADWSHPGGDTIALRVMRAKARNAAQRLGVLTFNFGGPGEGTVEEIAQQVPRPTDCVRDPSSPTASISC